MKQDTEIIFNLFILNFIEWDIHNKLAYDHFIDTNTFERVRDCMPENEYCESRTSDSYCERDMVNYIQT